jgi:hypothetical protein
MKEVTGSEFEQFIATYPNKLKCITSHISEPPVVQYFDGDDVVATIHLWSALKDHPFYEGENDTNRIKVGEHNDIL